jgi:cytoskeletal protein CcmA (bactofilin family)
VAALGVATTLLAGPGAAAAAEASGNVYMAGGQVRPGAAVQGDLVAVGGRVIIDQPVKGDALVAGGAVDLRAPLGDDLRAVGGDVTVDSSVGGEVFASGGSVTLARGASVKQSATLYGGTVRIDGRIGGFLQAGAQRIALNGEVAGDARLSGEQIALGPQARIGGALRYTSPNELVKSEGAVVTGAIVREDAAAEGDAARGGPAARRGSQEGGDWRAMGGERGGAGWLGSALTYLALLASGALLLLIFPRFAAQAADTLRASPGLAALLGFAALVAVPVLAVLLFITLLGIPLGVALLALYPLLLLGGYMVGILFIAQRAQAALRPGDTLPTQAQTLGFFALALLLVLLLGRLPWVGGLLVAAIAVFGIGACVLEIHRRRQSGTAAAPGR